MTKGEYDPRSVANAILDLGDAFGHPITNLALQKLLYFSHGLYLIRYGAPLVSGYFEAWENGPVHPIIYRCFKEYGREPIVGRAAAIDVVTGFERHVPDITDQEALLHLRKIVATYGGLAAPRLVAISHAPHGPWAETVNKARKSLALGMRITDDTTRRYFRFQKVILDPNDTSEVYEDTPFTPDRSGPDRAAGHRRKGRTASKV